MKNTGVRGEGTTGTLVRESGNVGLYQDTAKRQSGEVNSKRENVGLWWFVWHVWHGMLFQQPNPTGSRALEDVGCEGGEIFTLICIFLQSCTSALHFALFFFSSSSSCSSETIRVSGIFYINQNRGTCGSRVTDPSGSRLDVRDA